MSIVTKTGDRGESALFGGRRVSKDHARLEAYGTIDELSAAIGVAMAALTKRSATHKALLEIQRDLFTIGSELASPSSAPKIAILEQKNRSKRIYKGIKNELAPDRIFYLEHLIEALEKKLPPLQHFILPSGNEPIARLHLARAICRRAERRVAFLYRKQSSRQEPLIYLNRLSDLLFVMARAEAAQDHIEEIRW